MTNCKYSKDALLHVSGNFHPWQTIDNESISFSLKLNHNTVMDLCVFFMTFQFKILNINRGNYNVCQGK